jgi:hypothetical protein
MKSNKAVIFVILAVILTLTSPFTVSIAIHEYLSWSFGRRLLSQIQEIAGKHSDVLATGRSVRVEGSGDGCTFRSAVAFVGYYTTNDGRDVLDRLQHLKVSPAMWPDIADVEVSVVNSGSLFLVYVSDGPYGTLLDPRCF